MPDCLKPGLLKMDTHSQPEARVETKFKNSSLTRRDEAGRCGSVTNGRRGE